MSDINTYQKENPIFSFNGVDVDPTFFNNDVWLSRKDLQKLFRKSESSIRKALNEVEKVLQDKFSANSHLFAENDKMVQTSFSWQPHYKAPHMRYQRNATLM